MKSITLFLLIILSSYTVHGQQEWELKGNEGSMRLDYVDKGKRIIIEASGSVSLGSFAGSTSPKGIGGFAKYNMVRGAKHGALLCRVGPDGDWFIVNTKIDFIAEKEGYIRLMINDAEFSNNRGSFKGTVQVMNRN